MSELFIIILVLMAFIALGAPLIVAIGLSSAMFLFFDMGISVGVFSQKIFAGLDTFSLMAIPFFILAGEFMNSGGLTERIIRFTNGMVGQKRGALAQVVTIASSFFGAVSGSAVAGVSALGGALIPAMIKEKYGASFSAALIAISSVLVPIIPPSITMIMYGITTGAPIKDLFIGGIIPGLIYAAILMQITAHIAKKRDLPTQEPMSTEEKIESAKEVSWAMLLPFIIFGGIFSGVFTVTESAAVGAIYAFIIGMFIYKDLRRKGEFKKALFASVRTISVVMFLIASSRILAYLIALKGIPNILSGEILSISTNPAVILFILNIIFLLLGMFLESNAAIIIFMPIFLPLIQQLGIDIVHFGVVVCFNLGLGLVTPPFGVCLSLATKISREPMENIIAEIFPYLLAGIGVLFLITYCPFLVTGLIQAFN